MPLGAQLPPHHEPFYTACPSRPSLSTWRTEREKLMKTSVFWQQLVTTTQSGILSHFPTATEALLMFA